MTAAAPFLLPVHPRLGRHPDPPSPKDYEARQLLRRVGPAPKRVNRLDQLGPVLDQGNTPQCVAHAGASAKIYQERKEHHRTFPFDPHWLYARCKERDGIPNEDGTFGRVALDVLHDLGIARSDSHAEADVARWKIDTYARCTTIAETEQALATRGPVLLGIIWYSEWFSPPPSAVLRVPQNPNGVAGGHEVLLGGYDQDYLGRAFSAPGFPTKHDRLFLVRNSWGEGWGHRGTFALDYREVERQLALPEQESADIWWLVDVIGEE